MFGHLSILAPFSQPIEVQQNLIPNAKSFLHILQYLGQFSHVDFRIKIQLFTSIFDYNI